MTSPDASVEFLLFIFIMATVIVMVVRRMMRSPTESYQDSPLSAVAAGVASSVPYEPEPICDPDEKKAVMAKVEALEAEWNESGTPLLDDG